VKNLEPGLATMLVQVRALVNRRALSTARVNVDMETNPIEMIAAAALIGDAIILLGLGFGWLWTE